MEDMILYHGSRGGIEGDIKPSSRARCDFGSGFYMGDNPMQVKGLVVEDTAPVFYTLEFKLSEIPESRILTLMNDDWLYAILSHRKKVPEFNQLPICQYWQNELQKYDVIIGAIADDRMNAAMQRFADYGLTDQGLRACLQSIDYGNQIVVKSESACNKIRIISERDIYGKEAEDIRSYTNQKREESRTIVQQMAIQYQRKGLYLNEIVEILKEKQSEVNCEYDGR